MRRSMRHRVAAMLVAGTVVLGAIAVAPAGADEPGSTKEPGGQPWSTDRPSPDPSPATGATPAATGDLDPSWSGNGISTVQSYYLPALDAAPDGKLAVALYKASDGNGPFRVWRYDAEGDLDGGWGTGGYVLRGFATSGLSFPTHVVPDRGGHGIVGSYTNGSVARIGITKLTSTGAYRTLGSYPGRSLHKMFTYEHDYLRAFSVEILASGMIMAAVAAFDYNSDGDLIYVGQGVIRVNGVGGQDAALSGDGVLPVAADVYDIAFRSDGKIYMGRKVGNSHEIRRFNSNGTVDLTFSGDGAALVPCGVHVGADLEVDASGRVLVACVRYVGDVVDLRTMRMTTGGTLDPTYSGNGMAALVLQDGDPTNWHLAWDTDGRVYASTVSASDASELHMHSLDTAGEPNAAFSDDGFASAALTSAPLLLASTAGPGRLFLASGRAPSWIDLFAIER